MYFTRDPASDEFTEGDIGFTPIDQNPAATRSFGDVEHRLYRVVCPGLPDQQRWVRTGVTAADLIPGVVDVVEGQLQLPVPDVNPAPVNGGIVNVGLWLAVEDQVMAPVSAQAGPNAWITVSPRLASTRYGFGNGDAIDCEGTGVPIRDVHPDLDVLEQSPTCGYTYRTSSPDDDPYRLTVTTVWVLPYTSSQGGGVLTPLERSVTVDYDVDEIQTVGIAN